MPKEMAILRSECERYQPKRKTRQYEGWALQPIKLQKCLKIGSILPTAHMNHSNLKIWNPRTGNLLRRSLGSRSVQSSMDTAASLLLILEQFKKRSQLLVVICPKWITSLKEVVNIKLAFMFNQLYCTFTVIRRRSRITEVTVSTKTETGKQFPPSSSTATSGSPVGRTTVETSRRSTVSRLEGDLREAI